MHMKVKLLFFLSLLLLIGCQKGILTVYKDLTLVEEQGQRPITITPGTYYVVIGHKKRPDADGLVRKSSLPKHYYLIVGGDKFIFNNPDHHRIPRPSANRTMVITAQDSGQPYNLEASFVHAYGKYNETDINSEQVCIKSRGKEGIRKVRYTWRKATRTLLIRLIDKAGAKVAEFSKVHETMQRKYTFQGRCN